MVIYHNYGRLQPLTPVEAVPRGAPREPSRVIGYHNAIDEDRHSILSENESLPAPPSYHSSQLQRHHSPRAPPDPKADAPEPLPSYECSVHLESSASIKFERTNPFEILEDSQWTEVFIVLKGTLLSIHQLQSVGKLGKALGSPKPDSAGRVIKKYTLQHAEVGVASDVPKHELVPRTLTAAMWPQQKIKRMQQDAPHLFDHVRQYVIRLRLECDQILLRLRSWDDRARWVDHLCMAVDIAPPLEDRTEPTYHTLPRRRRNRQTRALDEHALLSMTTLIDEQERIMRTRFPHLLLRPETEATAAELFDGPDDTTADPEADDLDSAVVIANTETRARDMPVEMSNVQYTVDELFATQAQFFQPNDFQGTIDMTSQTTGQKSNPTPQLDRNQELRYRRRCMPALLLSSRRSNDIVMREGSRWQIDWKRKTLKPYPQPPPRYEHAPTACCFESRPVSLFLPEIPQLLRTIPSSATMDDSANSSINATERTTYANIRVAKSWKAPGTWSRRLRKSEPQVEETDGSSSGSDNSEGLGMRKLRRNLGARPFSMIGM